MARLKRLVAGDRIVEFLGPHTDRNYFSGHAPELHVQLFSSGSVQYQTNDAYMFRGERVANLSGQVPINHEQVPDGADVIGFADAAVAGVPAGSVVPALVANVYDFDVTIDGGALQVLSITVSPTDTYGTIAALMSAQVTGGSVSFSGGSFHVTSTLPGNSSTVVVAAGTAGSAGGDLFAAITAQAAGNPAVTFPAPTAGTSNWIDIGPVPLTAAAGLVVIPLIALPEINFIRAIVTVAGDGYLTTATHWD